MADTLRRRVARNATYGVGNWSTRGVSAQRRLGLRLPHVGLTAVWYLEVNAHLQRAFKHPAAEELQRCRSYPPIMREVRDGTPVAAHAPRQLRKWFSVGVRSSVCHRGTRAAGDGGPEYGTWRGPGVVAPGFHRCVFVLVHVFLALISSHEPTRESPLVPPDDMCNNTITTNSVSTAVRMCMASSARL